MEKVTARILIAQLKRWCEFITRKVLFFIKTIFRVPVYAPFKESPRQIALRTLIDELGIVTSDEALSLYHNNIKTFGDMVCCAREDIKSRANLSDESLEKIEQLMARHNMSWGYAPHEAYY